MTQVIRTDIKSKEDFLDRFVQKYERKITDCYLDEWKEYLQFIKDFLNNEYVKNLRTVVKSIEPIPETILERTNFKDRVSFSEWLFKSAIICIDSDIKVGTLISHDLPLSFKINLLDREIEALNDISNNGLKLRTYMKTVETVIDRLNKNLSSTNFEVKHIEDSPNFNKFECFTVGVVFKRKLNELECKLINAKAVESMIFQVVPISGEDVSYNNLCKEFTFERDPRYMKLSNEELIVSMEKDYSNVQFLSELISNEHYNIQMLQNMLDGVKKTYCSISSEEYNDVITRSQEECENKFKNVLTKIINAIMMVIDTIMEFVKKFIENLFGRIFTFIEKLVLKFRSTKVDKEKLQGIIDAGRRRRHSTEVSHNLDERLKVISDEKYDEIYKYLIKSKDIFYNQCKMNYGKNGFLAYYNIFLNSETNQWVSNTFMYANDLNKYIDDILHNVNIIEKRSEKLINYRNKKPDDIELNEKFDDLELNATYLNSLKMYNHSYNEKEPNLIDFLDDTLIKIYSGQMFLESYQIIEYDNKLKPILGNKLINFRKSLTIIKTRLKSINTDKYRSTSNIVKIFNNISKEFNNMVKEYYFVDKAFRGLFLGVMYKQNLIDGVLRVTIK